MMMMMTNINDACDNRKYQLIFAKKRKKFQKEINIYVEFFVAHQERALTLTYIKFLKSIFFLNFVYICYFALCFFFTF